MLGILKRFRQKKRYGVKRFAFGSSEIPKELADKFVEAIRTGANDIVSDKPCIVVDCVLPDELIQAADERLRREGRYPKYPQPVNLVKSVIPMDDYKLLLEFKSGEKKVYNARPILNLPIFRSLRDEERFKQVHLIYDYAISWGDNMDLCPDSLYWDSIPYEEKSSK
ncbi:MAG: DUF2442 domain-containing protein [Clostridiales bacterium]|nr:DUF2442 domain-containing protein [Clostridiales bacterium]